MPNLFQDLTASRKKLNRVPDAAPPKDGMARSGRCRYPPAVPPPRVAGASVMHKPKLRLPKGERLSPNHTRKLSDALLEFAREIAPLEAGPEIFGASVDLAIALWNVPLLNEADQGPVLFALQQQLAARGGHYAGVALADLLELRKSRYARDRRMVLKHTFQYSDKGPWLQVLSVDLDRPEHRAQPPSPGAPPAPPGPSS